MRHFARFWDHVQRLFLSVQGALFAQRFCQVADHLLLTVQTPANLASDLPQRELLDGDVVRRLILVHVIVGVDRGVGNACIDCCQVDIINVPLTVLQVVIIDSQLLAFAVARPVL